MSKTSFSAMKEQVIKNTTRLREANKMFQQHGYLITKSSAKVHHIESQVSDLDKGLSFASDWLRRLDERVKAAPLGVPPVVPQSVPQVVNRGPERGQPQQPTSTPHPGGARPRQGIADGGVRLPTSRRHDRQQSDNDDDIDQYFVHSPPRPRQRRPSQGSLGSAGSSGSSAQTYIEQELKFTADSIIAEIDHDLDATSISDDLVLDLHANVLPNLGKLVTDCDNKCSKYSRFEDHKEDLLADAVAAKRKATLWSSKLRKLYRARQLHLQTGQNKSFTGSLNLRKFSGDSRETVFEFFKKFEQLTKVGFNAEQRSMMLFNSYLDDPVRREVTAMSSSYSEMKSYLINCYGMIKVIIKSKLDSIRLRKPPSSSSSIALADHVL